MRIMNARYCHHKKWLVSGCAGMCLTADQKSMFTHCEKKHVWSFDKLKSAWIALQRVLWNHPGVYSLFIVFFISLRVMPNIYPEIWDALQRKHGALFGMAITPLLCQADSNKNVLSYSPALLSHYFNEMVKDLISRQYEQIATFSIKTHSNPLIQQINHICYK